MTKYQLTRYALGKQPSIDLSRDEYNAILEAKKRILEGLTLENLFHLMLGNYEEFERELLAITLNNATYSRVEWNADIDTIQLVARRLANLFSTTYGYNVQVLRFFSGRYGKKSEPYKAVKGYFSQEYDAVLGYRVCYELRNYAQHSGAAVHGFGSEVGWVDRPDGRHVHVYSFAPEVNVTLLKEDPDFKGQVLAELEKGGRVDHTGDRMWDIRPFVRDYISALGRVHLQVRELIAADLEPNDAVISEAVQRFCAMPGAGTPIGLAVMELSEKGLLEGRTPSFVSMNPIERRKALAQRNDHPIHFDTQVISNELNPLSKRKDHT